MLMRNIDEYGTHGSVSRPIHADRYSVALVRHAPKTRLPRHQHSSASLTIVLSGEFAEGRSRPSVVHPLWFVIKRSGTPHENWIGRHGACSLLIQCNEVLPTSREEALPLGADGTLALSLVRALSHGEPEARLELEALVAVITRREERLREHSGNAPPRWLERIRELVHHTPGPELRLARLAAESGRGASYLTRSFRRWYGMSIGEYARRLRVSVGGGLIGASSHGSLSRVAQQAGYFDHSHFTREFKAHTGMTPRTWRHFLDTM